MSIITFWNNNTGKTGQTYSALAIASNMAIEHNLRILLISTKMNDEISVMAFGLNQMNNTINFITNSKKRSVEESNIAELAKLETANRLTEDVFPNYTKMIFKNHLEIIEGPKKEEYDKIYNSCVGIVNVAKRHYDIVFVDLNNGLESEATKKILNLSDIIIYNIEQKPSELEELTKLKKEGLLKPNNTLILVNKYDRDSKYSTKNITRFLGEKNEVLSIPYNILYSEAIQEGKLAELFLNPKFRKADDGNDKNGFFIKEIIRAINAITYKMKELQMRVW